MRILTLTGVILLLAAVMTAPSWASCPSSNNNNANTDNSGNSAGAEASKADAGYNDARRSINDAKQTMEQVKQSLQDVPAPPVGAVPGALNGPGGNKSVELSTPGQAVTTTRGRAPGDAGSLSAQDRARLDQAGINRNLPDPPGLALP